MLKPGYVKGMNYVVVVRAEEARNSSILQPDVLYKVEHCRKPTAHRNIPIEQATKVDLVINRKSAASLQLTVPPILFLQAEKVDRVELHRYREGTPS